MTVDGEEERVGKKKLKRGGVHESITWKSQRDQKFSVKKGCVHIFLLLREFKDAMSRSMRRFTYGKELFRKINTKIEQQEPQKVVYMLHKWMIKISS